MRHLTVDDIITMKGKKKIAMLTAYDFTTAEILDNSGIDILLVGDSAGMVMLGYESTTPVTINEMLLFCKAVVRARKRAMVVADMPFMSYQIDIREAVRNAFRFVKESGVDAVKIEGGEEMAETVRAIVKAGIPVMGHIGLKPQTAVMWHGYRVQGGSKNAALQLIKDAEALEEAGAYCIVLEQIVCEVAEVITKRVKIPTIGIGSGSMCDGQVLVVHDLLGMYERIKPRFVKRYAELGREISKAVNEFREDILSSRFPSEEHAFHMDENELKMLKEELRYE